MTLMGKSMFQWILWASTPVFLIVAYSAALISRLSNRPYNPRIVFGSTPLINNSYWSNAMKQAGYDSETFTNGFYSVINKRQDWDRILSDEYALIPPRFQSIVAFVLSLLRYDVFITSFDGFFIGSTPFAYLQAHILRLAGKKIIVIPYGGDSFVYRRIRSIGTLHALLISYPKAGREQRRISRNVDYWCANADAVIPGPVIPNGFGRWDVLIPSPLQIDLASWVASTKWSLSDGMSGAVTIVHAPNHRGFKGTEFILDAVRVLKAEGLKIDFRLLEGIQNSEVRQILREDADILVEQVIFPGHGLNGLEGLASGLPVISNLEDDTYLMPMRRWSYFGECPIVSGSPETLVEVLRELVTRPNLRHELGKAGRAYVEKYHGLDSAQYLFTNVIDYVYGRRDSLLNLYHPLLGEYPNRSPKIEHPLVNNRICN